MRDATSGASAEVSPTPRTVGSLGLPSESQYTQVCEMTARDDGVEQKGAHTTLNLRERRLGDGVLQPAPRSANLDSAFGGMQLFASEAWRAAPLLLTRSAQLTQPTVRLPQL